MQRRQLALRARRISQRSLDLDAEEPEHEQHACQPDSSSACNNQDGHARSHQVTSCLLASSGQTLEQRDQQRENRKRRERTESRQGESPEWI
jgi:hypothetical protein